LSRGAAEDHSHGRRGCCPTWIQDGMWATPSLASLASPPQKGGE